MAQCAGIMQYLVDRLGLRFGYDVRAWASFRRLVCDVIIRVVAIRLGWAVGDVWPRPLDSMHLFVIARFPSESQRLPSAARVPVAVV